MQRTDGYPAGMATSTPDDRSDQHGTGEPDHRSDAMRHADTANGEPAADDATSPPSPGGATDDEEEERT